MPLHDVDIQTFDDVVVARVDGEIDMSNAAELGRLIADRMSNAPLGLVVDLRDVGYIDSAGIRAVYELRERLATRGQELVLVVAPGSPIADALRYAGMSEAMPVTDSPEAARRRLAG